LEGLGYILMSGGVASGGDRGRARRRAGYVREEVVVVQPNPSSDGMITWRVVASIAAGVISIVLAILLNLIASQLGQVATRIDKMDERLQTHLTNPRYHDNTVTALQGAMTLMDERNQALNKKIDALTTEFAGLRADLNKKH